MSGTSLLNSTSIASSMQRVLSNFDKMFNRKAYVHWYTQEGMDVQEFEEAAANVRDLISEYEQYEAMGIDHDGGDVDDEAEIIYEKASRNNNVAQ